jgi:hypothetical protein
MYFPQGYPQAVYGSVKFVDYLQAFWKKSSSPGRKLFPFFALLPGIASNRGSSDVVLKLL